ncbi:MAG: CapA family protein [Bacteroidales bacterium]|nr:CapA family protein [Bacteroidales bacterium]
MKIFGCGDVFVAKRLPEGGYEGFDELSALMKGHDACFGNLETTVHDNEGYPSLFPGGGYAMAEPSCLKDLKKFGFNVFNLANNHALDFCQKGLEATIGYLKKEGLPFVGAGMNLVEASRPRYVECKDGRVAFIGVTSSFHDSDAAGPAGGVVPGRPGINPLRRTEVYQVTENLYRSLQEVAEATGMNDGHKWSIANGYREDNGELFLREMKFIKGEESCRITHPLRKDMDRIVMSIKEARIQADCVVVSFHSHQMNGRSDTPAQFIVEFCHECIDAGAHAVFGHGAHELQGVEVYKGCPIFYGLGDFLFHNEMVSSMPMEFYEKNAQDSSHYDWVGLTMNDRSKGQTRGLSSDPKAWQAVGASISFIGGKIHSVTVYPVSLGFSKGRTLRGWPEIDKSGQILQYFIGLSSSQFGTEFSVSGDSASIILEQ